MKEGFRIRRARSADVTMVHGIHSAAIREGATGHYSPEVVDVWVGAFNPENFPGNIQRLDYFVAFLPGGAPGGFVALEPQTGEVDSVYVAPRSQGSGLGSFLLGFAEELGRQRGFSALWLDASLNAVSFYARYGWVETRQHARVRDGIEIPVVRMEKTLAP